MFVVVVNLGSPYSTTEWTAIGPFSTESAANAVMNDVNEMASTGVITIDRVMVVPLMTYMELSMTDGLSTHLINLQRGE